ncbi:MAG: sigma 54-interacting transcriptional regulator [Candidatus Aminicenantes bacterium]|nr:MAG: sigma 54-interacting transcriptional regulator [Candidatus Aminicenantes bacterium]
MKNQKNLHFDSSKKLEIYSQISEKISQLGDLKKTLDDILAILKKLTVCRHLAVRIIDSKGNIPFYAHLGLEQEFQDSEHWITVKDCLCGYVARDDLDRSFPFVTKYGSFYTNSMTKLMDELKINYPKIKSDTLRNGCTNKGYKSVAIIPVRSKSKVIAELYISDERENFFPLEKIQFVEKVCIQIGVAIQNSQLYTELNESQKKLMDLFHSASIGILELDTKGFFLQINSTGATLLGYSSPQRLLDHDVKINELNVDKEEWEKFIEATDAKGTINNFTLAFWIGKEKQYLEFSLTSLKDSKGKIIGYRGTFRDVTDRIRLEEERLNKARTESLKNRYYQETVALKDEIKSEYPFEEMIGVSPAMREIKKAIQQVAPADTTVLIKGATGTGKELVARYIHELSLRKERILVKVNCAALSEGLITSELFGHEKGAFTGAIQRRIGRFEFADRATIFLDEIGDLPLETQAMLLRVLQDGEFERVGSSKTIKVDVRLLAATNRDLRLLVEEKKFRQDLFFRLSVFPIEIAPLRERKEDIPLLTAYFLETYGKKLGKKIDKINKETMELFMGYSWPGNVRELQNVIEHGLVVSREDSLEVPESYFAQPSGVRRI